MSQTKGRSSKWRQAPGPSPDRRNASDTPSAGRRFAPALKGITVGGTVYGHLVAYERGRLGLSQEELAARVETSPATIARIEEGHPPGAELRRRLTETLYTEPQNGLVRRMASSVPMRRVPAVASPPPRLNLGSRRLWGGVAIALTVVLLAVVGSRLASGDGAPAPQPVVQVSSALGAPAAIHKARVEARKEAAAEARRAARQAREREKAAAAAAAAAAATRAEKAAASEQSSSADSQPAASPVESSPSPAPASPPSGGGGSNVPAPDVQHGIGSG
jgi:transcriptional regulator with XRE-family HTH domain